MKKAQKIVAGFLIIMLLIIAGLFIIYNLKTRVDLPADNTLYFSFTCSHCKIVEQFMEENNITSKINLTQKEVSLNPENAKELLAIGKYCRLTERYIGAIPLFYTDKKCYIGDVDIINVLKNITEIRGAV